MTSDCSQRPPLVRGPSQFPFCYQMVSKLPLSSLPHWPRPTQTENSPAQQKLRARQSIKGTLGRNVLNVVKVYEALTRFGRSVTMKAMDSEWDDKFAEQAVD